jgi:hypothetical protein
MNTVFWILGAIAAVYLLMILLAWYIGHPTPWRWYRPDMHPDDVETATQTHIVRVDEDRYLADYNILVCEGQFLVFDEAQQLLCVAHTYESAKAELTEYCKNL